MLWQASRPPGDQHLGRPQETGGEGTPVVPRTSLGYLDGGPLMAAMERAQVDGDTGFVTAHMPTLELLIARYQDRIYELSQFQYRARMIREHYEPRAEKRR
jgi:hypothetical protein